MIKMLRGEKKRNGLNTDGLIVEQKNCLKRMVEEKGKNRRRRVVVRPAGCDCVYRGKGGRESKSE